MTTLPLEPPTIVGGVDTHRDANVVAAIDATGRLFGHAAFPTTVAGHRQVERWLRSYGDVVKVGVEGTGAWGAGLARHLRRAGIHVVEVDRPDRRRRRRRGKTDPIDAENPARAVLAGEARTTPKSGLGRSEAIRGLRCAKRSAIKARTQAINQMHASVVTAPAELRDDLRGLGAHRLIEHAARFRPADIEDPAHAVRFTLRSLARRCQHLNAEIDDLDTQLRSLVAAEVPELLAHHGVGTDVAAALLVATGDNPERLSSEASFAALCGVAPMPASSGLTNRHRLNRGGNRDANNALWRIVIVRLATHQATRDYMTRRRAQGLSKREVIRCLKRYVARELYATLRHRQPQTRLDKQ
jgi:transposase